VKSTSKRFYFDYNATSPLATSVKDWLTGGEVFLGNSSALHSSGKAALKFINETRDYLLKTYSLDKTHQLFFHSGATEGINTLTRGFFAYQKGSFFCSSVDHAAVFNLQGYLAKTGISTHLFSVNKKGEFDKERLIEEIKNVSQKPVLLNITWVNNETGVVWPLNQILEIKKETGCLIHLDAVQTIGKIPDWDLVSSEVDALTFSGHKFGALTGVGFSFVKKNFHFEPLLIGGGQQEGWRSGTVNSYGIYSLKLAVEEFISLVDPLACFKARLLIEEKIKEVLGNKGEIVAEHSNRCSNTFTLIIKGKKTDSLLMAFDLAGIDVGTGAACSSGLVRPSRVLNNMGFSEDEARSSIRFSFGPDLKNSYPEYSTAITDVLQRLV